MALSVRAGAEDHFTALRRPILDGAEEFLWSHPFRDLTVGELMFDAGASRPAIL